MPDSIMEDVVLNAGDKVSARTLTTIEGAEIAVPAIDGLVHLQFRRFAACPICSLHMHEVAARHDEITNAGITEIVVFHSAADALRRYQAELPFAVIADPERTLYGEFGVASSLRAILHPGPWRAGAKGLLQGRSARDAVAAIALDENHLGMPADFLIDPDGDIVARKYGEHADDQWSVDELLALADR